MKRQYIITKGLTFDRKFLNEVSVKILSEIGDLFVLVDADENQFRALKKEEGRAIKSINENRKVSIPRLPQNRFEYNLENLKKEENGEE